MARAFEQVIQLQLARFSPEEAKRRHIAIARQGLATFMARQAVKPQVTLEVDGHRAASETEVRPFGVIVYRFLRMREIVSFALAEAERLSPVRSGRYRRSWFLMSDGKQIGMDAVPNTSPVLLTNDQPYSRKINVGAKGFERYVPPGIVEKVRQLVLKRYRSVVTANIEFVTLQGGHVLRRSQRRIKNGRRYGGFRRDALKGMPITYPGLLITPLAFV